MMIKTFLKRYHQLQSLKGLWAVCSSGVPAGAAGSCGSPSKPWNWSTLLAVLPGMLPSSGLIKEKLGGGIWQHIPFIRKISDAEERSRVPLSRMENIIHEQTVREIGQCLLHCQHMLE